MKVLLLATLVLIVGTVFSENLTDVGVKKGIYIGGGNINLVSLGNVEGRSYFYDNSNLDWFESREACREYGMELATIKTEGQVAFLLSKYNEESFDYWIGARDSRQPCSLAWDDTDKTIAPLAPGLDWGYYEPTLKICGTYLGTGDKSRFETYACTVVSSNIGYLCETY